MKELLFLRHAKSFWGWSVEDQNRPLQPKGMYAIECVAKHWTSLFQSMDVVFSSSANRALSTATIMMRHANLTSAKLIVDNSLYTFNAQEVCTFVNELPDPFSKVILVGHNPAFSDASQYFCSDRLPELKTADFVHLRFSQSKWTEITNGISSTGSKKEAIMAYEK